MPRRARIRLARPRLPVGAEMVFVRAMHERLDLVLSFARARIIGEWGQHERVHGPQHPSYRGDAQRSPWVEERLRELAVKQRHEDPRPVLTLVAQQVVSVSNRDIKRLIPISMRKTPDIGPLLDSFRERSLARIKDLDEASVDLLRDILDEAEHEGWRVGALEEQIAERIPSLEGRAETIARTQTLQFNAEITRERQTQSGIARFIWSTSGDERVRDSHEELDGEEFSWDDLPEVDGEKVMPGEPVNCFPADSEIQFAHDVKKAYRRWFDGELAEIVTDSGKTLRGTPNHPVLTARGWLPLGELHEGDHVIEIAQEVLEATKEDHEHRAPLLGEVFQAALILGTRQSTDLRVEDFHGDGADGQVDVVLSARGLFVDVVTARSQCCRQLGFAMPLDSRLSFSALSLVLGGVTSAAHGIMGSARKALSLLWRQAAHSQELSLAFATSVDAGLDQALANHIAPEAKSARDREFALARGVGVHDRRNVHGQAIARDSTDSAIGHQSVSSQRLGETVFVDADELGRGAKRLPFAHQTSRIINARRINWSGHVYNLETSSGWYVTNGIVAHNCRCVAIPVLPDFEEEAEDLAIATE